MSTVKAELRPRSRAQFDRLVHLQRGTKLGRHLLATAAAIMISSAAISLSPVALKYAIDLGAAPGGPEFGHLFWLLIAGYVAAQGVGRVGWEIQMWLFGGIEQMLHAKLRKDIPAAIIFAPAEFHLANPPGLLVQQLNNATRAVSMLFQSITLALLPIAIQLLITVTVVVSFVSVGFFLIMAMTLLAYVWSFSRGTSKVLGQNKSAINANLALGTTYSDLLSNIETIKMTAAERFAVTEVGLSSSSALSLWKQYYSGRLNAGFLTSLVFVLSVASAMFYAAHELANGAITVGGFSMVAIYMVQLVKPLESIGLIHRDLAQSWALLESSMPPAPLVTKPVRAVKCSDAAKCSDLPKVSQSGHLTITGLTFDYPNSQSGVHSLAFEAKPGETIALVGPSGSGKTTVLRLIAGLYTPQSGAIRVNGCDVCALSNEDRRRLFSVTPQDPALFDISLRENLCLGEIGVTDKDIVSILERLNMRDVIDRLANGLETRVGPRGGKLSIGERQRIGVARALLRPAPIMLFDEPTAALDVETEQKVVDEMSTRLATRTKIVITHRKAALRDAARIIVMEDGCVAQVGSHQELLDSCEFYRALWNS